jgi:hypothetical protein
MYGSRFNFGGLSPMKVNELISKSLDRRAEKQRAEAMATGKLMKPAVMPPKRPIMKINRPPTISAMFKGNQP